MQTSRTDLVEKLKRARETNEIEIQAECLLALIEETPTLSRYRGEIKALARDLKAVYGEGIDEALEGRVAIWESIVYLLDNDALAAEEAARIALAALPEVEPVLRAMAKAQLGLIRLRGKDTGDTEDCIREAEALLKGQSEDPNYPFARGLLAQAKAQLQIKLMNFQEAIRQLEEALTYFESDSERADGKKLDIYLSLGVMFQGKTGDEKVLPYLQAAYDIAHHHNSTEEIIAVAVLFAPSLITRHRPGEAIQIMEESLDLAKRLGMRESQSTLQMLLARLLVGMRQFDSAVKHAVDLMNSMARWGDIQGYVDSVYLISDVYLEMNDLVSGYATLRAGYLAMQQAGQSTYAEHINRRIEMLRKSAGEARFDKMAADVEEAQFARDLLKKM
jgi:tetratricopeptide (TPR) repeat protein